MENTSYSLKINPIQTHLGFQKNALLCRKMKMVRRFLFLWVVQASFLLAQINPNDIIITEIMYNPPESGQDSLEFIEIYNRTSSTIDLAGYILGYQSFGRDTLPSILLPPNGRVVFVKNATAFLTVYGIAPDYQWVKFTGLSNMGATIYLFSPSGIIIDSVTYGTSSPWPTAANGQGPSLVLCDENADNDDPANWTTAVEYVATINGRDLRANPKADCSSAPVATNAYPTSSTSITVVFDKPVSATAEDVNNYQGIAGITSAVRAPSLDTVFLTLSTPLPIGIYDTLIVLQAITDTLGIPMTQDYSFPIIWNDLLPKLVITEIMYNPPSMDTLEFIELYNADTFPIPLGGMHFSAGITYAFPETTLAPGQFYLLCNNAPAFFSFFGIVADQFSGALINTGELIAIQNTAGQIVDSVRYAPSSPWPSKANGQGSSLALIDVNLDNGDPANWCANLIFFDTLATGDSIFATPNNLAGCTVVSLEPISPSSPSIIIYPNPSSNYLNILTPESHFHLTLFNLTGKIVWKGDDQTQISLIHLPEGIYFLEYRSSYTYMTFKVMKK
jgi:hypothetical protein